MRSAQPTPLMHMDQLTEPLLLPAAAVVIASRNRPRMLCEAMGSVLAGREVPAELIVVDQSDAPISTLPLRGANDACELRYFWTREIGLSRANNTGIRTARSDLIAFTHDDVLVDPNWFGTLIRELIAAGPRSVVTGRVPAIEEAAGGFAPTVQDSDMPRVYQGRPAADVLPPLNMALRRSTIDEIGGFDERLGPGSRYHTAEDNDFGYRLLEAGYRIVYAPQAVVRHRAWRTRDQFVQLRWTYGRGQGAFYAKHLELRDRYMLGRAWWDVRRHACRIPVALRSRNIAGAWADAVYSVALLSGMAEWLLRERTRGR
jgi:GT2 family glycosyltransferase